MDARWKGRRRRTAWILVVVFVVGIYAAGFALTGMQDALAAVSQASISLILAALALEIATIASLAMVHRSSTVAVGQPVRYPEALNVSMSAFTLTQSLPGGGAVAGAEAVRRLSRFGMDGPIAAASVALTATLATSTIAGIGAIGIALAFVAGELAGSVLVVTLALFVLLVAFAVGVLLIVRSDAAGDRLLRLIGRIHRRLAERAEQWREPLTSLASDPPSLAQVLRIVAWSGLNWAADIAALFLVFVAYGRPVTVMVVLVGFALSQLAAAIPVTPGGVGFVEGGMVGTFVALGVPASTAAVVVVTYRLLATWVPSLAGVVALLRPPPDPAVDTDPDADRAADAGRDAAADAGGDAAADADRGADAGRDAAADADPDADPAAR